MKKLTYKTVSKEATAELIEKKSRFITTVRPIKTEAQALELIAGLRTKYYDATHNVYAYMLGENNICRYSDDGEPTGTAGVPTLEVIKKEELTDVVVVVTRYFGGIMLGAGGLVRAYGKAARLGISKAEPVIMQSCDLYNITCDYTLLGRLLYILSEGGFIVEDTVYTDEVTISVCVKPEDTANLINSVNDISGGQAIIEKKGQKYIAVKIKKGEI